MKMTKKKVLLIAVAVSIIAILSLGSLAWFNSTADLDNTFKFATDDQGQPDFSVDVYENLVDEEGNFVDTNNDGKIDDQDGVTYDGNTYSDILPGNTLDKNPTVKNTGAYDQYIRAYVSFPEAKVLQDACAKYSVSTDLREWLDIDASVWTYADTQVDSTTGEVTYCFYLNEKLAADKTATLFNSVTIPFKFQQVDAAAFTEFNINVDIDALQTENVIVNNDPAVTDAQEAFNNVSWAAFIEYPEFSVTKP